MSDFDATPKQTSTTMDAVAMTEQPPVEQSIPAEEQHVEKPRVEEPLTAMETQQKRQEAEAEAALEDETEGADSSRPTEEPCEPIYVV